MICRRRPTHALMWASVQLTPLFAITALVACSRDKAPTGSSPAPSSPVVSKTMTSETLEAPAPESERQGERKALVDEQLRTQGIKNERVLAAMRKVPRHLFVPEELRELAYRDRPLPIGSGQTISQPYIVAAMSEAAALEPADRCLEIGTGSGYQAAVLAELCGEVYSIEYLPELAKQAASNLRAAGVNVHLRTGDGYGGWPEAAPFDAILVTAAPDKVPQPLLDQLALGGRLVIPVGPVHDIQRLELWKRVAQGSSPDAFERSFLADVRFVPFLGDGDRTE